MAIGHWLQAWKRTYGTDRRANTVRRPRPFRPLEALEDRSVPAVTVAQDPLTGIVTVNLGAANDAASIAGTNFAGEYGRCRSNRAWGRTATTTTRR